MQIKETPTFGKQVKRLHANQKADLDQAVRDVLANPFIGEAKKGDLAGVGVHKFRLVGQLALLAYEVCPDQESLILHAIGSHENFYRDLKQKR
jgi:mRNA-degrading endonuclease YafQ of YafQ-DinJ toxin-antitoxin module